MDSLTLKIKNCRGLKTPYYVLNGANPSAALIFLFHGCPDGPEVWFPLIEKFKGGSNTVIAPFLRGIGESEGSKDNDRYSVEAQILDVLEILNDFPKENKIIVVCHDLGSVLGWELARKLENRLHRLIAINSPDPVTLLDQMKTPSQLKKSWYIFPIQLENLSKLVLGKFKIPLMRNALIKGKYPDLNNEIIEKKAKYFFQFIPHYQKALRFMARQKFKQINAGIKKVQSPLVICSTEDAFLNIPTVKNLKSVSIDPELRVIEGGHWSPLERTDEIFRLVSKGIS